ncbi:uncharacterized protein LOC134330608 [Trichomycterus rosablanca]|uniref:uncharacterized protein LOC134330608 n=1 Tax=Trichomycterus rosablanca TaxID=2290929 RepID=UPI002F35415D
MFGVRATLLRLKKYFSTTMTTWSAVRDRLLSFLRRCCQSRSNRLRELEAGLRAERRETERLRDRLGKQRKSLLDEVDRQIRLKMLYESEKKRCQVSTAWKGHLYESQLQQYQESVASMAKETEKARSNVQDAQRLRLKEEDQHRLVEEGLKAQWEEERSTARQEKEEMMRKIKKLEALRQKDQEQQILLEKRLLVAVVKVEELAAVREQRLDG